MGGSVSRVLIQRLMLPSILQTAKIFGEFNTFINGLSADTTYYVRAYAINKAGIAYSDQVIFKTLPKHRSQLPQLI
jgi:hypothetical protein